MDFVKSPLRNDEPIIPLRIHQYKIAQKESIGFGRAMLPNEFSGNTARTKSKK
jgi:hypothetical protein